ncbi:MAG: prepilin-type N-terminal cleavage/methylation domain-containing protein [Planctomycetes bacterium]|nr:prepilin-type N-terminal cleavage/methylation domain-containing protein [Planctomycetota bacterium]
MTIRPVRGERGFSLIEILVVLTIMALLMGFTVVAVSRYRESGRVTECRARIESLKVLALSYADRTGDVPPSRLAALGVRGANKVNEGIEAFVVALGDERYAGERPTEAWLGNTDDDRSDDVHAATGGKALLEILDPWDNPFAYIASTDYDEPTTVRVGGDGVFEDVEVHALRNPLTDAYHEFESFQIRSAGPDGLFDTEDDLANFESAEPAH